MEKKSYAERHAAAQALGAYLIGGQAYPRVRYGDERDPWDASIPCHDCGVTRGEFHLPSCDVEECPKCGEQAIGCECAYAGDEDA